MRDSNRKHVKRGSIGQTRAALLLAGLLGAALAAGGCDGGPPDPGAGWGGTPAGGVPGLDRDLQRGDSGDDVRALQAHLTGAGYFPNDRLARDYPAWRPLVSAAPADGVYDERTEAGVRAYQRAGGLPATGVVDQATRVQLAQPKCAVPEGIRNQDPRDKFLLANSGWSITHLTWKMHPTWNCNITAPNAAVAINQAFNTWALRTNRTFQQDTTTNSPTIWISCQNLGQDTAQAFFPSDGPGSFLLFNNKVTWSVADNPQGAMDLQSVALHEIGHILGLHHSSLGSSGVFGVPAMFRSISAGVKRRNLATDDTAAIGIIYNPWQQIAGCAKDIGVSANGEGAAADVAWMVGCNNRVHKWNGSGWTQDTSSSAPTDPVAIAVQPNGQPWVVRSNGVVLRKSGSSATSGSWQVRNTGCARDIGISGDVDTLDIWTVGCGTPDGIVRRHDPQTNTFQNDGHDNIQPAAGTRIAVGDEGRPWVVNSFGDVYRKTHAFPDLGFWEFTAGGVQAVDIGVFRGNDHVWAWITTTNQLHLWDEQDAAGSGNCSAGEVACAARHWQWDSGTALRVSVGSCGGWAVASNGQIYKRTKCETGTTNQ